MYEKTITFSILAYAQNDARLSWENKERNEYVAAVFDSLHLSASRNIVFLGHSRACENALKLAQSHSERGEDVISAILINSPGLRVHRGSRPRWIIAIMAYLARLQNSWLDYFLHPFLKFVYNKFIGLRVSDGKVAAAIIQPIMTMEYEKNKEVIKSVRENEKLIVLHAWGGEDFLIEPQISIDYASEFGNVNRLQCHKRDEKESEEVKNAAVDLIQNGSRMISIGFDKEGHYIQKFQADLLVSAIDAIVQRAERHT
ncbi:hypothetical protein WR25_22869 [Diploscapter pachys]|uniref:AB hydrolase-1 domain-containing protein n=1 Tax=Diploscapter pachys TaxID=2018661 RepID=A0A2A2K782_9BILA|nr:hypothetical protein WR25_22869 [Diploscapter pachys]